MHITALPCDIIEHISSFLTTPKKLHVNRYLREVLINVPRTFNVEEYLQAISCECDYDTSNSTYGYLSDDPESAEANDNSMVVKDYYGSNAYVRISVLDGINAYVPGDGDKYIKKNRNLYHFNATTLILEINNDKVSDYKIHVPKLQNLIIPSEVIKRYPDTKFLDMFPLSNLVKLDVDYHYIHEVDLPKVFPKLRILVLNVTEQRIAMDYYTPKYPVIDIKGYPKHLQELKFPSYLYSEEAKITTLRNLPKNMFHLDLGKIQVDTVDIIYAIRNLTNLRILSYNDDNSALGLFNNNSMRIIREIKLRGCKNHRKIRINGREYGIVVY
jgi:hypothetical protein